MRILVVDDHQPTIELMELTLSAFGHVVSCANNIAEALDQISSDHPDVVLSDLLLSHANGPEQDGYALARTVRANPDWSDVCLLAVTGLTDRAAVQRALDSGFHDVVIKPFDVEDLIDRLEDAVGASNQ